MSKQIKKNILVLLMTIALVFVIGFVIAYQVTGGSLRNNLSELGISFGEETFEVQDSYQDMQGIANLVFGEIKNQHTQVSIKVLSNTTPNQLPPLDVEKKLFESLFDSHRVSYPEFVTREIECPVKFLPVLYQHKYGEYFATFANDRLGYGVCSDDSVAFRAGVGFFYCPSTDTSMRIDLFSPIEDTSSNHIKQIFENFSCQ